MTSRGWRTVAEAAISAGLAFAMSLIVLGPLLSQLDTAWAGGDMLSTYVNSVNWGGFSYRVTDQTGFPLGMDLNYFPGIDITENTVAALVNGLLGTTFAGINLLVVLSFPLVAALAYLTIRLTGLQGPLAIALAVAFSVIPFHWGRALGHTYLSTLYSAVLGLALVLLVGSGMFERRTRTGTRRSRISFLAAVAVMVVVIAWTGIYYVAFTLILGGAALVWRLAQRARVRQVALEAAPFAGIGVLAAAGFVPALLTLRADPPLASLGERTAIESVTYAGNLAMAILPIPQSSFPRMGYYNEAVQTAFAEAPFGESTAITNFGTWVTAAALIVVLVALVVRQRRAAGHVADEPPRVTLGLTVYLTVVSVLFFVPWGLNFLFADLVTAQIRAWNRLLPFLLLLFLVGAAAALHRTRVATSLVLALPISLALLAVTAVDSVHPFRGAYAGSVAEADQATEAARAYARTTNAALPADCGVLQLPYMAYPEHGLERGINDYDHFWTSITNPGKQWSYGAVKFTDASVWAAQLPQVPSDRQADLLREAGFCAIHVDTRGYVKEAVPAIVGDLTERFGPPVATGFKDMWLLFALGDPTSLPDAAEARAFLHPPFIEADPESVSPRESELDSAWWWTTEPIGEFALTPTDASAPLSSVSGAVTAPDCGPIPVTVTVRAGDQSTSEMVLAVPGEAMPFSVTLDEPTSDPATLTVEAPGRGCPVEGGKGARFVQVLDLSFA